MFEFKGKIIAMLDKKEGIATRTGKKYVLQEFVVESLEQYPHRAQFTMFGEDKINQYALASGDYITITFNVNATESKGKWYNSFNVFSITKEKDHSIVTTPVTDSISVIPAEVTTKDDLPF